MHLARLAAVKMPFGQLFCASQQRWNMSTSMTPVTAWVPVCRTTDDTKNFASIRKRQKKQNGRVVCSLMTRPWMQSSQLNSKIQISCPSWLLWMMQIGFALLRQKTFLDFVRVVLGFKIKLFELRGCLHVQTPDHRTHFTQFWDLSLPKQLLGLPATEALYLALRVQ